MEQNRAIHAFATLGHPGRMAVFRLLMRFAPQGVRPTEIAEALGLKQNTLSHHLADLAGSAIQDFLQSMSCGQHIRNIVYRGQFLDPAVQLMILLAKADED